MRPGNHDTKGQPGIAAAALFGLCPNCRARSLFDEIGVIAETCSACGLDYTRLSEGDGQGWLLVFLIAAALIALAIGIDIVFAPPFWAHALIWTPVTLGAVFYGLRLAKASLVYRAYRRTDFRS